MSHRDGLPLRAGARGLVWLAASLLFGCSGPQPLAPIASNTNLRDAASPAIQAAEPDQGTRPVGLANLDPVLQFTMPRISRFFPPNVPPTFTVHWQASDPDAHAGRPLEYRYLLVDENSDDFLWLLVNPDSLVRRDGPSFARWTRVPGVSPELGLRDLPIHKRYVLAIVAIDADGGFNRVFSTGTNLLVFAVDHPSVLGPVVSVLGDIVYEPFRGGLLDDPADAPHFVVAPDRALSIQWTTRVSFTDDMNGTRWALDPKKLDDPSHGPGTAGGWSGWSTTAASATVGPFTTPGEHRLYIEARTALNTFTRVLMILDVAAPDPTRARSE